MTTAILPSTEYHLPEAARQAILASIPPEIQYPGGVVPDDIVQEVSEFFPELLGRTNLQQCEMKRIMCEEVDRQWKKFVEINGEAY